MIVPSAKSDLDVTRAQVLHQDVARGHASISEWAVTIPVAIGSAELERGRHRRVVHEVSSRTIGVAHLFQFGPVWRRHCSQIEVERLKHVVARGEYCLSVSI